MIYTHSLPIFGVDEYKGPPRLPPPCWCGAREQLTTEGVYVIRHDMQKHGLDTPASKRLTTEELMGSVDANTLDHLGGMREA